jgi:sec-independent protein translocase protein TatC
MWIPIAIRGVAHDDQLTLVGHLDELRSRIIVSLVAVAIAFGFCFWQNNALLHLINLPLAHQTQQQVRDGHGPLGATYQVQRSTRDVAVQLRTVVGLLHAQGLKGVNESLNRDIANLSVPPQGDRPITLGVGEPFTTTVTVSLIFALILALPIVLWQLYGFLMPALEPEQRRHIRPLMSAIPVLFITGVAFGYFVVLPAALHFFQNFNTTEFNVLVQAAPYYKFAASTILAMGLLFQVPVGILAITRAGVVTPRQLRRHRRYAVAACALVAAILPGDAITMLLETVPLYLLFELSLVVATISERRARLRGQRLGASGEPVPEHGLGN